MYIYHERPQDIKLKKLLNEEAWKSLEGIAAMINEESDILKAQGNFEKRDDCDFICLIHHVIYCQYANESQNYRHMMEELSGGKEI